MQPTLLLSQIQKGRNPRNYFDEAQMNELIASVRQSGIIQPLLVRPLADGYQIVAGERRYRAALAVYGEGGEVPVMIKEMSDEEADIAALVENANRADMSPTEEAVAAARVTGRVKGDREEACRVLGWSRSKLDSRLGLMNCSQEVRKALDKREIMLGHAELLATLAKETQDKLLTPIVSEKKTVAELKATIEQAACKLDNAIFDKAECSGCPHNSALQRSMFAETIVDGHCTNPTCYKGKTEAALEATKEGLKDEYPVIRIVRAGDNATLVPLQADGVRGVGQAQAEACRACANFGAAVSAIPHSMGKVYKEQCFDPGCNASKVAARIKAEEEAKKPAVEKTAAASITSESKATASAPAATPKKDVEKATTSISETERVKAYRVKLWRVAMKREIASDPAISARYLVAMCINGDARHVSSTALGKAFEKLTGISATLHDLGKTADVVGECSEENLSKMTTLLAASAMDGIDEHQLKRLARHHKLDLTKHWKLDKELLDLLTKSEIEFMAKEIGLDKAVGDGFKKLFTEKKGDLIERLLKVNGFDYSAVVPKVLQY